MMARLNNIGKNTFIMNLKYRLGLCTVKHCYKKSIADVAIPLKNGKKIKRALCDNHLSKVLNSGSVKSVTVEQTYSFEDDKEDENAD